MYLEQPYADTWINLSLKVYPRHVWYLSETFVEQWFTVTVLYLMFYSNHVCEQSVAHSTERGIISLNIFPNKPINVQFPVYGTHFPQPKTGITCRIPIIAHPAWIPCSEMNFVIITHPALNTSGYHAGTIPSLQKILCTMTPAKVYTYWKWTAPDRQWRCCMWHTGERTEPCLQPET